MVLPPAQTRSGVKVCRISKLENCALITRDAHVALAELKILVDWATEKLRTAERETVGVAIGHSRDEESPSNPARCSRRSAIAKIRSCRIVGKRKDAKCGQLASRTAKRVRFRVVLGRAEDKTCLQTVPIEDAGGPGSLVTHSLSIYTSEVTLSPPDSCCRWSDAVMPGVVSMSSDTRAA